MKDTPPEVSAMLFTVMMRKTPTKRLLMGFDMSATARTMAWSSISTDMPEELRPTFFLRYYGELWLWKGSAVQAAIPSHQTNRESASEVAASRDAGPQRIARQCRDLRVSR